MSDTFVSKALSWIARGWSVASILFVGIFLVGEGLSGDGARPSATEWIGLALWPGGVGVGLVVGWFRTRLGGILALGSLVGFYVWYLLERGMFPRGPYFFLVAAPGVLFLFSSLWARPAREMRSA